MNTMTDWLYQYFDELTPKEFYRVIFPEGELDERGAMTPGKYTGIIVEVTDKMRTVTKTYKDGSTKEKRVPVVHRHTLTDSLEEVDEVLQRGNFCLTPPLSYAGKVRSADNARFLYAIAIDLDCMIHGKDGKPTGLLNMFSQIERAEWLPRPTMIVSSGTGLHLYYVFEKAIPLFPNIAKQLQKYKHRLTQMCWNEGIVTVQNDNDIQYEGIYQGFRMPGTITKKGKLKGTNERARCFMIGKKVTMEYMNEFVEEKYQVTEYSYKSKLSLKEAAAKYPEWYEERIVKGNKEVLNPWALNRNVYDWWKRQILSGSKVGHRYWCLWVLSIYAKKCSFYDEKKNPNPVTREELEEDAWELMEFLEEMTNSDDNHFTEVDVMEALEAFEDKFISYPKASIRYKANIPFEPSIPRREKGKRLKQPEHLEEARAIRDIRMARLKKDWREGNGRPVGSKNKKNKKKELVMEYIAAHPEANVTEIARETGMSRTTVYKHLPEPETKSTSQKLDYVITMPGEAEVFIEFNTEQMEARRERLRLYLESTLKERKHHENDKADS